MEYKNSYAFQAILILLLAITFTSCSSDLIQRTDIDLLTSGSWKVESIVVEPLPDPELDIKNSIGYEEDCREDDLLNLNLDKSYYLSDGQNVCSNGPYIRGGTWELVTTNNRSNLEFLTKEAFHSYQLESVSKNTLVLKREWAKTGVTERTTYQNTTFE